MWKKRPSRYIAKAADGSMRDALSLLDQCIAFYLGETLTYDNVLEVLGAVDTDEFSKMLREILLSKIRPGDDPSGRTGDAGTGPGTVCQQISPGI